MKYTEEHEWLRLEGDVVTVGITQHASEQLGDLVFVELPSDGQEISKDQEIVVIESVKAASDILAPLDGVITAVNNLIVEEPSLVNSDPMGEGWFFKMKLKNPSDFDGFQGRCRRRRHQQRERAAESAVSAQQTASSSTPAPENEDDGVPSGTKTQKSPSNGKA